jgi:hypothetical protein
MNETSETRAWRAFVAIHDKVLMIQERSSLIALRRMETPDNARRTPMKKILISCAAALIMVAANANTADAQRGKSGFSRGGSGGVGAFRGGGARIANRGAAFRGGPAFRTARIAGGPGFHGRRAFRRGVVIGGVGAGLYPYRYAYGGGCYQHRLVPTPVGLRWRLVNVCGIPVAYRYAYPYTYGY